MPLDLWGVRIYEPMTVLTNFILAGMCFFYFKQLKLSHGNWALFFLFLGLSTFCGAIGHGYSQDINNPVKFLSRIFAIFSVVFGGAASISSLNNPKSRKILLGLLTVQSLAFLIWLIAANSFVAVKYNSILGLGVIVLGIHIYHYAKNQVSKDFLIALGIIINASAAIINTYKLGLSPNFTYHDVGHVVLMIGIFFMYRGISQYAAAYAES